MKKLLRAVIAASLAAAPAGAAEPKTFEEMLRDLPNMSLYLDLKEAKRGADFVGLKAGRCDSKGNGPIQRLHVVLRRWNAKLDLGPDPGCFSAEMAASLTLFKAVYGTGIDGHSVDPRTADLLGVMEGDPASVEPPAPRRFPSGEVLYWASRHLGKPYEMGADGVLATDCGMLTKLTFLAAGLVAPGFTRLADIQYLDAKNREPLKGARSQGKLKLALRQVPTPGSLVFFRNATYQSGIAYDGVTHVGLFIAGGGLGPNRGFIMHASSSRGVVIDTLRYDDAGWIAGFGEILVPATPAS